MDDGRWRGTPDWRVATRSVGNSRSLPGSLAPHCITMRLVLAAQLVVTGLIAIDQPRAPLNKTRQTLTYVHVKGPSI